MRFTGRCTAGGARITECAKGVCRARGWWVEMERVGGGWGGSFYLFDMNEKGEWMYKCYIKIIFSQSTNECLTKLSCGIFNEGLSCFQ